MIKRIRLFISRLIKSKKIIYEISRVVNKTFFAKIIRISLDFLYKHKKSNRNLYNKNLNHTERNILFELNSKGWARLPITILNNLGIELSDVVEGLIKTKSNIKSNDEMYKTIWEYLVTPKDNNNYSEDNVIVKFALNKPVLRIVSNYLGETPWLRYAIVTRSIYADTEVAFSQKWHNDFDDVKMVKLFVYLSDVESEKDGPFMLFDKNESKKIKNSFIKNHLTDEAVSKYVSLDKKKIMYGKILSTFLVDTSRVYHCGSRVHEGHSRLLYTALFTVYPSIYAGCKINFSPSVNCPDDIKKVLAPK